jgi:hypothetical protein
MWRQQNLMWKLIINIQINSYKVAMTLLLGDMVFLLTCILYVNVYGDTCDSSYPDFCIQSPSPDLNCDDIVDKNFKVLPPDPHRLDGDKNGIGCVDGLINELNETSMQNASISS